MKYSSLFISVVAKLAQGILHVEQVYTKPTVPTKSKEVLPIVLCYTAAHQHCQFEQTRA